MLTTNCALGEAQVHAIGQKNLHLAGFETIIFSDGDDAASNGQLFVG